MKTRFHSLWCIVLALVLVSAVAPVLALSGAVMAGGAGPTSVINDIPDEVSSLTSISGYAEDTDPLDYVAEVKIRIWEDTNDNGVYDTGELCWNGITWQDVEGWLSATATDGSFNTERESWQYTSMPSWGSGKD